MLPVDDGCHWICRTQIMDIPLSYPLRFSVFQGSSCGSWLMKRCIGTP